MKKVIGGILHSVTVYAHMVVNFQEFRNIATYPPVSIHMHLKMMLQVMFSKICRNPML
jgi:hypothetical protein